jgi:polar amino acid transport system substrate-binding protein
VVIDNFRSVLNNGSGFSLTIKIEIIYFLYIINIIIMVRLEYWYLLNYNNKKRVNFCNKILHKKEENVMKLINKITSLLFISIILSFCFPVDSEAARTSIKVAVNHNMPPFQHLDENGNIVGLHIDIMDEIALNEDLIVEYITFSETNKSIEALENGLVDVILGIVSRSYTDSVNSALRKSNDISSATLCMLVGNENISKVLNPEQNIIRHSVAFEINTISFSQLNSGNNTLVGNQVQLYEALTQKSVDAVIGVKESMIYLLEENGTNDSYTIVHNYISSVNYSMLTRQNDRVLHNSINRGIGRLRSSGTYEQLLDKWITDIELEKALEMKSKLLSYIGIFVSIAIVIISITGYMNRKLKKTVDDKTKEISKRVQQLENESILRERLIEFLPVGIIMLKDDGSVLTMNSIIRALAGIEKNMTEKKIWNISELNIVNDIYKDIKCNVITAMERPVTIKLNKNEDSRVFRCQCQSIDNENNEVMMVEDITREEEEKQEIYELRKSKALNRIIAGMAHEIKNPLMSINTFASLIKTQGKDYDFLALFAQHVPNDVERINRLINLLINYSRPIRSKKELVSVSELINDSIYFAQISTKNTEQIKFITNNVIREHIYVNRDQIKQSLINLIMNSIQSVEEKLSDSESKFPDGLVICVSSYRRNKQICIEVYDEGLGMTEGEIEKCIEPFFTTKAKGLGMGLALTKQFVNENSGKLELESRKNEYTYIRMIFEEAMK